MIAGDPPVKQDRTCSTVKMAAHAQLVVRVLEGGQVYLRVNPNSNGSDASHVEGFKKYYFYNYYYHFYVTLFCNTFFILIFSVSPLL